MTMSELNAAALSAAFAAADEASPIGKAYSPGIEAAIRAYLRTTGEDSVAVALRDALVPFARLDMPAADKWTCGTFLIDHADIRRARAALAAAPEGGTK